MRIYLSAVALAIVPIVAAGQDLIFSSESDDGSFYVDDDLIDVNFQEAVLRLREIDAGTAATSGDVNGDGRIDIVDPIFLLNWIFNDGPRPLPLACASPVEDTGAEPQPFPRISLHLERNETDGDTEVVLRAASEDGLRALTVHDPLDRKVVDMRSADGQELGFDKFVLESGDPASGAREAFPHGAYLFQAVTTAGRRIAGIARLTHELLPAPDFTYGVDASELRFYWPPVSGASSYVLEIKDEVQRLAFAVRQDADKGSFSFPHRYFTPGLKYTLSMTTVTPDGNRALAESTFVVPLASSQQADDS